ncbi:MAG: histidine phosphatase family protein [Alphaproteobacteria bacterium]|nr:histidine phosphatase family protein [Alphaproteobacteria bacterium]
MPADPVADASGLDALETLAATHRFEPGLDTFLFLRHGRTLGNIRRVFQHPDDPLAPEGHGDAASAADLLAAESFSHIVASDMSRAWQTAGRVAARTGRPVHAAPALRERHFGDWIGTPSHELDWRASPPGGETLAGFIERSVRGLREALATGQAPLLVAHGGTLHVLCGVLGARLDAALAGNAVPLRVRRAGQGWAVTALVAP